jgi:hypothetical protein
MFSFVSKTQMRMTRARSYRSLCAFVHMIRRFTASTRATTLSWAADSRQDPGKHVYVIPVTSQAVQRVVRGGMNSTVYFSSTAAKALGDTRSEPAYPWLRPMEEPMKITDTVDQVLKNKALNKVLPVSPEQTVHEALSLMAEYDVGALMVMSGQKLVGILSERDYARKGILRALLQGHQGRRDVVS